MKIVEKVAAALALPGILVIVWWLVTRDNTNPFVPKPEPLVSNIVDVWWHGGLLIGEVVPSLTRLGLGLGFAIVIGVGLGVLIGSSVTLRNLTGPLLEFIRAVPPPVLLPVLMMLLGIDDRSKIVLIVLGCLWPILLNTVDGVRAVDPVLSDTTRTCGITGFARFRYFVLPASMPRVATGIRLALPIAIILMVVSEMYAASDGLGFTIIYFQRTFQNVSMWAGVVLLGLIGVLLAVLFRWGERRLLSWYYGQREVETSER
ncbi:ABC transporter permease [Phytoactinopolyspora mesophila]|uniref:ABC transporter permease subunit n=1 Tax=Phytoactinopolyspora mesophila TaxID=2650750 RepID=A0A7K3LZP1_9ACTN|nr:ABC transporter permease [Phytoactinopolyspora mesophila]NDL56469.1 ABC transporter permease subunit [Phytoactinopolyspora mesophila]